MHAERRPPPRRPTPCGAPPRLFWGLRRKCRRVRAGGLGARLGARAPLCTRAPICAGVKKEACGCRRRYCWIGELVVPVAAGVWAHRDLEVRRSAARATGPALVSQGCGASLLTPSLPRRPTGWRLLPAEWPRAMTGEFDDVFNCGASWGRARSMSGSRRWAGAELNEGAAPRGNVERVLQSHLRRAQ